MNGVGTPYVDALLYVPHPYRKASLFSLYSMHFATASARFYCMHLVLVQVNYARLLLHHHDCRRSTAYSWRWKFSVWRTIRQSKITQIANPLIQTFFHAMRLFVCRSAKIKVCSAKTSNDWSTRIAPFRSRDLRWHGTSTTYLSAQQNLSLLKRISTIMAQPELGAPDS